MPDDNPFSEEQHEEIKKGIEELDRAERIAKLGRMAKFNVDERLAEISELKGKLRATLSTFWPNG